MLEAILTTWCLLIPTVMLELVGFSHGGRGLFFWDTLDRVVLLEMTVKLGMVGLRDWLELGEVLNAAVAVLGKNCCKREERKVSC